MPASGIVLRPGSGSVARRALEHASRQRRSQNGLVVLILLTLAVLLWAFSDRTPKVAVPNGNGHTDSTKVNPSVRLRGEVAAEETDTDDDDEVVDDDDDDTKATKVPARKSAAPTKKGSSLPRRPSKSAAPSPEVMVPLPSATPTPTKSALPVSLPLTRPGIDTPLKLLSIDFHISPIADLKDLVKRHFPVVEVVDRSLSGACGRMGTCATANNLKVLRQGDPGHSLYYSAHTRRVFFDNYDKDPFILDVDAMVCSHPSGMCELYMPFNRSLIIWATTRFEQGREGNAERFAGWVKNLRAIAAQPGNVILANNLYDVHYVHYFTGIMPQYVPSYCAYPGVLSSWTPQSNNRVILLHGYRPMRQVMSGDQFVAPLRAALAAQGGKYSIAFLRDHLGDNYEYSTLASHPAILHVPYQVSIMSFYEHYRMGIPIIAPSLQLLTRWHMDYLMVSERTWDTVLANSPRHGSVLAKHPDADEPYDPNDEFTEAAVQYWLSFADYYEFPHVILFDSWEDLANKISATDFAAVSRAMLEESKRSERKLVEDWQAIWRKVIPHAQRPDLRGKMYEERMNAIYGVGAWAEY